MDAVKFLEEWQRMCDATECTQCGAKYCCIYSNGNAPYKMRAHNDFIKIVSDWSTDHPRKTRLQDFLEKYPNAKILESGVPKVCASLLGYCDKCETFCENGSRDCFACWNKPLEE